MAQDFPESKYDYRLKPEMRSFDEVIVHVAPGIAFAAKAGRGEKVKWDELSAKNYSTKAECVALMQKWIGEANAALRRTLKVCTSRCSRFCRSCSIRPNITAC